MIADSPHIDGKYVRPDGVVIKTVDPFDGHEDIRCRMPFHPRKASHGHYTKTAKRLRAFSQQSTGPRRPEVQISYQYNRDL